MTNISLHIIIGLRNRRGRSASRAGVHGMRVLAQRVAEPLVLPPGAQRLVA